MPVKIRLMRIGAKKRPFYRVVAVDERRKRTGGYLELLGTYNPLTEPKEIKLNQERIDDWVKKGAVYSTGFLRIIGKAPQKPPRKPKKEKAPVEQPQSEQPQEQAAAEQPVQPLEESESAKSEPDKAISEAEEPTEAVPEPTPAESADEETPAHQTQSQEEQPLQENVTDKEDGAEVVEEKK
ncbi:30S ribosomal protein S16 [Candidatus Daviesbacteria bacterium]|nr:30S ribosomal protein S16 [Candidatus Daviesbacteria bacterium]